MPKILDKYSFNVAKNQTKMISEMDSGQKGGKCPKNCKECQALNKQCSGCDNLCPDKYCKGEECARCPFLCHRGGERLKTAIDFIGGLGIDEKKTNDSCFPNDVKYIPAFNKKPPKDIKTKYISVPIYAIYDFDNDKPKCQDIHDYFKINKDINIILNFYCKDDKIMALFDMMIGGKFIDLMRYYQGISYYHTPCFSVFSASSSMDCALNFKRQFWIGDIMREAGLNTIQEVLYSTRKNKVEVSHERALEIVIKKGIKKISQCGQLNFDEFEAIKREMPFIRKLPPNITWIITGLNNKMIDAYKSLRKNMVFCNYSAQFSNKKNCNDHIISNNIQ